MSVLSLTSFKTCTKCGSTKPASVEFFGRRYGRRQRYQAQCLVCTRARSLKYHHKNKPQIVPCYGDTPGYSIDAVVEFETGLWCRVCAGCSQALPMLSIYFGKYINGLAGLKSRCRECRNAETRAYEAANSEQVKNRNARYNEVNRDKVAQRAKRYRKENREQIASRRRRDRHKRAAAERLRRLRKKSSEHEAYSMADLNSMWHDQGGMCFYCDDLLFDKYHIEHKTPLSRGGPDALRNICLSCPSCNSRKNTKTAEEFMSILDCQRLGIEG